MRQPGSGLLGCGPEKQEDGCACKDKGDVEENILVFFQYAHRVVFYRQCAISSFLKLKALVRRSRVIVSNSSEVRILFLPVLRTILECT